VFTDAGLSGALELAKTESLSDARFPYPTALSPAKASNDLDTRIGVLIDCPMGGDRMTALCVGEASVSARAIATRLQLDKSVVSRRIKVALAEGYLVNRATGKGQPQALVLGDPLPEDRMLLPEPASLTETGCSVADDTAGEGWSDPFNA